MGGEDRGGEIDCVPILETARLRLRPFALADAPRVELLASDQRIAAMTLNIPHPYPQGGAAKWIATHAPGAAAGTLYSFAIERQGDGLLLGAIGLVPELRHRRAEMGTGSASSTGGRAT